MVNTVPLPHCGCHWKDKVYGFTTGITKNLYISVYFLILEWDGTDGL